MWLSPLIKAASFSAHRGYYRDLQPFKYREYMVAMGNLYPIGTSTTSPPPHPAFKAQSTTQNKGQRECKGQRTRMTAAKLCLLDTATLSSPKHGLHNGTLGDMSVQTFA